MSDIIHFLPGEACTLVAVNSLDDVPLHDAAIREAVHEHGLVVTSRHPHSVREVGLQSIASVVLEVYPPLAADGGALRAVAGALVEALTRDGRSDAVAVDYLDGHDPMVSTPEDFARRTVAAFVRPAGVTAIVA